MQYFLQYQHLQQESLSEEVMLMLLIYLDVVATGAFAIPQHASKQVSVFVSHICILPKFVL